MEYDSDDIDRCCEKITGHTNWAYFDTLTQKEQKSAIKNCEIVVVFFEEEAKGD